MNIDVYDSYFNSASGELMHFDVFVASGTPAASAHKYGQLWLQSIGEDGSELSQSRCNFCHSEIANPQVASSIREQGYYILKLQGFPG